MKKYFLIFTFFALYSCSDSSKEIDISKQEIPNIYVLKSALNITFSNDTVFLNSIKYSGYLYEMNSISNDTLLIEGYINGLQSGISKKWYSHKKLMEIRMFNNGKKDGRQVAYWENGFKKFDFIAKEDVYEGELKEWNIDGKLIHLGNYKNGQEEGAQKLWYDNGKIRANFFIINGKRYGLLGTKNCVNVSDSIFSNK